METGGNDFMKKEASGKKRKGNRRLLAAVLVLCALVAGLGLFFQVFHIRRVEVEGNLRYTDEEIENLCMVGPLSQNSILMSTFQQYIDLSNEAFLDHVSVEYINRNTILLRVTETRLVGMFVINGYYYYFDQFGEVTEVLTAKDEEEGKYVPEVSGLGASNIGLGHIIEFEKPQALNTVTAIRTMTDRYGTCPDKVEFDADLNITLTYGDITVLIGQDDLLEEKLIRTDAILPSLTDYKGTLHLENFTRDTENIVFDTNES